MNNEIMIPSLDNATLQAKVNEAAMKGAIKSIEEFYTGYDSPYMKAVKAELAKQEIGTGLELPDVVGLINQSLSVQIDQIANAAVASTFVPLVSRFLTRTKDEVLFSEILKEFIDLFEYEDVEPYQFSIDIEEEPRHGWLDITLLCEKRKYVFTLHKNHNEKSNERKTYIALSLPRGKDPYSKMKIKIEGADIEMPFTPDVLRDNFTSYIARLILSRSIITMDVREFDDDMFPEKCHCH